LPALPRVANIDCSRIGFQPGDRVLVKCFHRLDSDQERKMRQTICRWAGCEVEVLIVCTQDMDLTIEHSSILPPKRELLV
jgi:hypothetical protein